MIEETLKEDSEGEVILAPVIEACWSSVGTESSVSIGKGNDGATSGASLLTLPLFAGNYEWGEKYGLKPGESPFFEFVYGSIKVRTADQHFVQIRSGPKIEQGLKNFIPRSVTVKKLLTPKTRLDLLAWEKQVQSVKDKEGVVIYLPGMSLASHWAVHGIQNGIPVYTQFNLQRGQVLEPEVFTIPEPSEDELKDLATQLGEVEFGWAAPAPTEVLKLSMLMFHHSLLWEWGPVENRLRAHGVMGALTLGLVACLGELRHWWGNGPGRSSKEEPATSLDFLSRKDLIPQRDSTYDWVLRYLTWEKAAPLWEPLRADFTHHGWPSSYGGEKWAACAKKAHVLYKRVELFKKGPTKARWDRVFDALNDLIHVAHNGGRLFSKWISTAIMNGPVMFPSSCTGEALGQVLGLPSPDWEEPDPERDLWAMATKVDEYEDEEEDDGKCNNLSCGICYPANDDDEEE